MIDPFKTQRFLKALDITREKYWLLERIMIIQSNYKNTVLKIPSDENLVEFSVLSEQYQQRHKSEIDWIKMCYELEEKGYLEIWGNRKDLTHIKINELKLTEKFLQHFYINDVESAFEEFIKLYPKQVRIKDAFSNKPKLFSVWGKNNREELIEKFQSIILKGNNNILFTRFMELTKLYLQDNDSEYASYNIESYFKAFDGIAHGYEAKHAEEMNKINLFDDDI